MASAKPRQHGRDAGDRGLIGRREQLAVLEEAVRRAETGEPQFVMVSGEAGVGKTHLIGYVADRLQDTGARSSAPPVSSWAATAYRWCR
jgi:Cdc6-like AAA superfamily ATPase